MIALGYTNTISLAVVFISTTIAVLLRDHGVEPLIQLVAYTGVLSGILILSGSIFLRAECTEESEPERESE